MKHFICSLFIVFFLSCNNDEKNGVKDYRAENDQEILDYLEANNLEAKKSTSGLYYIINTVGTGEKPNSSSSVTVAYKGYFTNGSVFDQSDADGISFGLNQVIKGWTEGIQYFNEGGDGILFIPSHLGYGSSDYSSIPGGSVLIFDIKLLKIN
ncbi:FKBP-type peptidyl-prolyl isomerase-like protein [Maribacter vaceletii]|uniref:Peptidyl-prolyl cis-trans isomerase n=1 Tax=Maribacter vaceletii TaxID=1206816 RepID=A0A495E872_9FLAO|nr:FKBP-type peptidyl-prolyl cis-trans isomerase [Maribacter vaceletii]RKR13145.1 FKBP-type peptidyl-prolyl isomerase-like protein [Maribacter vaceletii]